MMMSKPSEQQEDEAVPAFATPPPAALNVGSVADLERRLAEMGTQKKAPPQPPPPTYSAAAPVAQVPPAVVKGGKNALLARIMAAKEKQTEKKAPTPTPPPLAAPMAPPPTMDLLTDFDAPSTNAMPPPSYETNFLKDAPPPAFDLMSQQPQMPPPPPIQSVLPPPPPLENIMPPPPPLNNVLPPPPMPQGHLLNFGMPAATAPMFEDLHVQQPPPPLPPPMAAAPPQMDIDESILNALEPAEREAFLEEQRKILEQIEQDKSNNEASAATARAMAFDQRSSSAVANVAASYERTGRAPSSADDSAAAQMLADAELAERLQKEEYARSEQRRSRAREGDSTSTSQNQSASTTDESSQSWYGWLTGAPKPAPATRSATSTSYSRSPSSGGGLVSAVADESVGLMGNGTGGGSSQGGARVAEQKSMFSCVAGSMGSAVTQMYAFQSDDDGNVHGVDSQGLLAMPDVSRQRE